MKKLKLNKKRLGVLLDHQMRAIRAGEQNTVDNDTCDTHQNTITLTSNQTQENSSKPIKTCAGGGDPTID